MEIELEPRRVLRVLVCTIVVLALANLAVVIASHGYGHFRLYGLVRLFNANSEANIPSYFSALQLAVAAALLGAIAMAKRSRRDRFATHWTALAFIFAYLSVDEAAILHEMWIVPMREHFVLTGIWTYAWYIPYGLFLTVFAWSFHRFVFALEPAMRRRCVVAGSVFLSGAVGLEMACASLSDMTHWSAAVLEARKAMFYSVEEPLEMLGIALFVHALLHEAARIGLTPRVRFVAEPAAGYSPSGASASRQRPSHASTS